MRTQSQGFYSYFEINFALRIKDLAQRGVEIWDLPLSNWRRGAGIVRVPADTLQRMQTKTRFYSADTFLRHRIC